MPQFFFHLYNDVVTRDEEGLDLPGAEAALREARRGARSLAAEHVMQHGRLVLHHFIEVEDANGETVAKVTFGDAIAVED